MGRCQQKGIKLNSQKLELKAKEVSFHGQLLTTEGLKPDPEKGRAIVEMPRPEGRDDILWLNGMVNYRSHFLPNPSDVMKPLRDLTQKDAVNGAGMTCKKKLGATSRNSCLHPFWRTTSPQKLLKFSVMAVRVGLEWL